MLLIVEFLKWACMLGVKTSVSVNWGCLSIPFVVSIGVQCVKMSSVAIEYCCYIIKINAAYQNNSFHIWQW